MTDNEKLRDFVRSYKGAEKSAIIAKMAALCMDDRRKIHNFMNSSMRIPALYKAKIEEAAGVKIF